MAKRRTRQQIESDQVIKEQLNVLGEEIYQEARETSRYRTGQLFNSINYGVEPDTVLTMYQVYYGADVRPKGVNSGPLNALLIAVKKYVPKNTNIIVQDLMDEMLEPFKT
jgi:hypothetical protein